MTREIKFEYIIQLKATGLFSSTILTLAQIERAVDCEPSRDGSSVVVARRQFTGVTDKNGKNVFDGDIVNAPDLYQGHAGPIGDGVMEVYFDEHCLAWMLKTGRGDVESFTEWTYEPGKNSELTVIGNRFESPELLDAEAAP